MLLRKASPPSPRSIKHNDMPATQLFTRDLVRAPYANPRHYTFKQPGNPLTTNYIIRDLDRHTDCSSVASLEEKRAETVAELQRLRDSGVAIAPFYLQIGTSKYGDLSLFQLTRDMCAPDALRMSIHELSESSRQAIAAKFGLLVSNLAQYYAISITNDIPFLSDTACLEQYVYAPPHEGKESDFVLVDTEPELWRQDAYDARTVVSNLNRMVERMQDKLGDVSDLYDSRAAVASLACVVVNKYPNATTPPIDDSCARAITPAYHG